MTKQEKEDLFQDLEDYYFKRDDFVNIFDCVFNIDEIIDIEIYCQQFKCFDNFHLFFHQDTFYILHLPTGILISWYKHLGRCNTCNNSNFDIYDLQSMLKLLKKEI